MKVNPRVALASAALALASSATAQPPGGASKPCLTPAEVETLVSFALPSFVEGLGQKCSAVLPPASYLRGSARTLAARYRQESPVPWTTVEPVLGKLGGGQFPQGLGSEFGGKLMGTVLTAALLDQVETRQCATADRIVEALAPLPAKNTARLAGMLLDLGSREDKDSEMPFRLCPATVPAR